MVVRDRDRYNSMTTLSRAANVVQAAIAEEIYDIIHSAEIESDINGKFYYGDGSLVIPVMDMAPLNVEQIDIPEITVEDKFGNMQVVTSIDDIRVNYTDIEQFYSNISSSMRIKKISNCDIHTLVSILTNLTEGDNEGILYGAALSFNGVKINPLHPMVAMMIINRIVPLPETFTCILYPYQRQMRDTLNIQTVEHYEKQIKRVVAMVAINKKAPIISYSPIDSVEEGLNGFLRDENSVIRFREKSDNIGLAFTPVQFASRALTIPWYGLIESKKNNVAIKSRNIFPFLSGNIGSVYMGSRGSTCTGELDARMFGSLYVLNNMNINSMYTNQCMMPEYHNFVAACHRISMETLQAYLTVIK